MTSDDLTPDERDEAQLALVRLWFARRRRRLYAETHVVPARLTYDMGGRVIEERGRAVRPRVSTFAQDRG